MFGQPFSRYSLRKYITMFGALFSNIVIDDGKGGTKRVPITHANKEYFWQALNDYPNKKAVPPDSNPIPQLRAFLPRMSYQIIGTPTYDVSRKRNQLNEIRTNNPDGSINRTLQPVPYIIPFELSIWTRTYRDMLLIVEQIVPFFQPHYNVTVKEYPDLNVNEYDVPVNFSGSSDESELESGPGSTRMLRWSLTFEVYGHLAPPTFDPNEIIKTVVVDFTGIDTDISDVDYEPIEEITET